LKILKLNSVFLEVGLVVYYSKKPSITLSDAERRRIDDDDDSRKKAIIEEETIETASTKKITF